MEQLIEGTFLASGRGFGFVTAEGGDLYIAPHLTNGAMHKDKVECRMTIGGDRRAGEVVRVLSRGYNNVVGVYLSERGHGIVTPDEKKLGGVIFIPRGKNRGAGEGNKVVVKITRPPAEDRDAEGEVTEIIGHVNDPGVDVLSVLKQMELPIEFGEAVMSYAMRVPQSVSEADCAGREDFRGLEIVTVDGADTKDIDDAISFARTDGGFELGVHIADVAHYVTEGSPIDKEAYLRGTSLYLADRVVPMLPHALSNGICSLNPNVDRLALSCIMRLDMQGTVTEYRIVQSVIRSRKKMTYTIVDEILTDENSAHREEYAPYLDMLADMNELAGILREKRFARGAIGFDFPEAKISVDADGWPTAITPYRRSAATGIIEEFMIAANETVAENYFWLEMPFVYRSHEEPDTDKLMRLRELAACFNYTLKGHHSNSIQTLLSKAEGAQEEHIINRMVLQSLKQARYTSQSLGHFGLASKYYCHFTSPIRRYPDLQIHRIIKEYLAGGMDIERIENYNERLPEICDSCSKSERAAETAERDVTQMKKAQFMSDKVGRVFGGIISGMTNRGMYVELPNTVEGMISFRDLVGDRFTFDPTKMCCKGEFTKKIFRVGDRVRVKVVRVSIQAREIDFELN